jgi:hypothetical protein
MTPSEKGSVSEAQLLAALVRTGHCVLVPYGDHKRYDLAIDENGALRRIQVKTGRLDNGVVIFKTASKATNKKHEGKWQNYEGSVDYFGVYCPQNAKCYLVPAEGCTKSDCYLRIDPVKNSRVYNSRWAKDYELGS